MTTPKGRIRVGCWAHVRRKFFEAKDLAPEECRHALDSILQLYAVEYRAAEENLLGSDKHLAILQSLVSSCQINGVDPQAYLTDVLIRIQFHPQSRIDELLPHRWQPP